MCAALALASFAAPSRAQTTSGYVLSTIAGNNTAGYSGDGGPALEAQLSNPVGVAVDTALSVYIVDQGNRVIRQVQANGTISTLAGNTGQGLSGDGGSATSASFYNPSGVAVASNGDYYIADPGNNNVRKVTGGKIATFAGSASAQPGFAGDTGAATSALLSGPSAVALDASGNLYIADMGNNRIRKVDSGGIITTVAGGGVNLGDGFKATTARLDSPRGIAFDAAGNLYIADSNAHRIRKVAANGIITTVAGTGVNSFSGDGGQATSATLNNPRGVAVDGAGNLFISDYYNLRVRKVTPDGVIASITGTGQLAFPTGLTVDKSGRVYVADTQHNVIRVLTPVPVVGGVISASAFGAFQAVAPGTWIEIYGSNLANSVRGWAAADFTGGTAPTALDKTTVTIGGQSAYIDYVSGGQVNALVPSNVAAGSQPLVVGSGTGTGDQRTVTVNTAQPGLLAPPSFKVNGTQYVAALYPDNTTFVAPAGAIAGATSRAAKPGDTIVIYGVGFGQVNPDTPAGRPAPANTSLVAPLRVFFGQTEATTVQYKGLSPGSYGLYQFNVVVPNVPANAATPLTFQLGGVSGSQTLYTAVQN